MSAYYQIFMCGLEGDFRVINMHPQDAPDLSEAKSGVVDGMS